MSRLNLRFANRKRSREEFLSRIILQEEGKMKVCVLRFFFSLGPHSSIWRVTVRCLSARCHPALQIITDRMTEKEKEITQGFKNQRARNDKTGECKVCTQEGGCEPQDTHRMLRSSPVMTRSFVILK